MATIAIFDSGVGGLSVYHEVVQQCYKHNYIFVSDNQAFPYGTKSTAELSERVIRTVAALVEQYTPDLLVIACNTASTVMLPALRAIYDFPIVGVVPAVKPAALLSQNNVIGLLATPATIKRAYTNELIEEFAAHCEVVKVGSSELVQIAEDKLRGKAPDMFILKSILAPFFNTRKLDVLVLACTHFPILNKEISTLFKEKNQHEADAVKIIDSGAAIAHRVASLLHNESVRDALHESVQEPFDDAVAEPKSIAVFTQNVDDRKLLQYLSVIGFTNIQFLSVD